MAEEVKTEPTLADHLAAQNAVYAGMAQFVELYKEFVAVNINPAQIPSPWGLIPQKTIEAEQNESSKVEDKVQPIASSEDVSTFS